ncbi:MAG: type I restriction endonuclease, partial [Candidatus Saccharimonadales bacterium]
MNVTKISESSIEDLVIGLFQKLGYSYVYAPSVAPDSDTPERERFEDVLLLDRLRAAVARINPTIPADIREEAIKQIQRLNSPDLIANNEAFHRMLTEGIRVSRQERGHERGDLVWLVDFAHPENNEFIVANQFTVVGQHGAQGHQNKRPDVVLFVNGLPLVMMELKNATDEEATIGSAYRQL